MKQELLQDDKFNLVKNVVTGANGGKGKGAVVGQFIE